MKARDCSKGAILFAALTIIGCSISALISSERHRGHQRRTLDQAVENWEGEGGAVIIEAEETTA